MYLHTKNELFDQGFRKREYYKHADVQTDATERATIRMVIKVKIHHLADILRCKISGC